MIEEGADRGAPKYMEWYGAFGLMVTLIWLYLRDHPVAVEAARSAVRAA